ncbi:MAG: bifunctional metallophosphatase/5'-nucleotidase [Luteolibacter sp.]|jgi:5'-nucleotidase / UDP-sugar diphosphatase
MHTLAFDRRRFLKLGLGSLIGQSALTRAWSAEAAQALDVVSVIHTTDLHGNVLPTSDYAGNADLGGIARCATRISQWRAENPRTLLIDAGDLYQGTETGFRTRGKIMTDCLNHLNYDAWVLGNHEFDWGVEAVHAAVEHSAMPVLAANGDFDGHQAWIEDQRDRSRVLPYVIRETGGYRIALVGMTTPGMPNWFLPELLGGFHAHDPLPVFEKVLREIEAQNPDAIVLITHMGGRPGNFRDDEANRVAGLAQLCRRADGSSRVAAIIAGHTHQHQPDERVFGTPYTQASYFGIHLGRLNLGFDPGTRKLVSVDPGTERMDSNIALDPAILALTHDRVEEAEAHLDEPAGVLADELSHRRQGRNPTDIERLIGRSIHEGLTARGIPVDAVMHGMLFTDSPWPAGEKTIRNVWEIIPFENFIVTAEVTLEALMAIAAEGWAARRPLLGLAATFTGRGRETKCTSIRDHLGRELEPSRRFTIAVNSYDAAGGAGRLATLRRIMDEPASKRKLHPLQSRALLVDLLRKHNPLGLDFLMTPPQGA